MKSHCHKANFHRFVAQPFLIDQLKLLSAVVTASKRMDALKTNQFEDSDMNEQWFIKLKELGKLLTPQSAVAGF